MRVSDKNHTKKKVLQVLARILKPDEVKDGDNLRITLSSFRNMLLVLPLLQAQSDLKPRIQTECEIIWNKACAIRRREDYKFDFPINTKQLEVVSATMDEFGFVNANEDKFYVGSRSPVAQLLPSYAKARFQVNTHFFCDIEHRYRRVPTCLYKATSPSTAPKTL